MDMPIRQEEWEKTIRTGAEFFELSLTNRQIHQFYHHAEILLRWNRKTNLTAIRDPREMAVKHFVDSFGPVRHVMPMTRVLDVGSGGGFPGLPLKVYCPSIDLTVVEAGRKKTSFLQHVIRELRLGDVSVIHERVETLVRQNPAPHFDTIVCRAFSDLSSIVKNLSPLLAPQGKIVAWKGRMPDREIRDVLPLLKDDKRALILSTRSYKLPIFNAERTLVILTAMDGHCPP